MSPISSCSPSSLHLASLHSSPAIPRPYCSRRYRPFAHLALSGLGPFSCVQLRGLILPLPSFRTSLLASLFFFKRIASLGLRSLLSSCIASVVPTALASPPGLRSHVIPLWLGFSPYGLIDLPFWSFDPMVGPITLQDFKNRTVLPLAPGPRYGPPYSPLSGYPGPSSSWSTGYVNPCLLFSRSFASLLFYQKRALRFTTPSHPLPISSLYLHHLR
jgi:hypothetical protein